MPPDSSPPAPVLRLHGPDASALLFDATRAEGRRAAADFFRRFAAAPPLPISRASRRAGIAALCGEDFCRQLETASPRLPWELI